MYFLIYKTEYLLKCSIPFLLQEEEIPELEIDIDELLELSDEGQRSRLQVRQKNNLQAVHGQVLFYTFTTMLNSEQLSCHNL